MNFTDISELHQHQLEHEILSTFTIDGVHYNLTEGSSVNMMDVLKGVQYAYTVHTTKDEIKENMERIVLTKWKYTGNVICPVHTFYCKGNLIEQQAVGLDADVTLLNFNRNEPIKGKVDTGADLCALHATNVTLVNGSVTFTYNGTNYNAKLVDTVEIVRAGDTQKRYCVAFDVLINSKKVPNVKFTLSDRSGLDSSLLIGKNLLSQSGLHIDPSVSEYTVHLDYNFIQEQLHVSN